MISIVDIDPIILGEDKEADLKVKKSWHWGNTGYLQKRAVLFCKIFINNYMDDKGGINAGSLIEKMKTYKDDLKYDQDDESGYAYATVNEMLNEIEKIARVKTESNKDRDGCYKNIIYLFKSYFLIKKYRKFK